MQRATAAREARTAARRSQSELNTGLTKATAEEKRHSCVICRRLKIRLRNKDYNEAEARLREMLKEYPARAAHLFCARPDGESRGYGCDRRTGAWLNV